MPASLRKICRRRFIHSNQHDKRFSDYLGIDFRRLSTADSPAAVDNGEWDTRDTFLARVDGHLLDFFLKLGGLEEFDGLGGQ